MLYEKREIRNIYAYLRQSSDECIVIPARNLNSNWGLLRRDAYNIGFLVFRDSENDDCYFIRRYEHD